MACILGMAEGIFFKIPPLSGGHLHCKFGAIQIRHQMQDFVVPSNILTLFARARFLGPHDTPPCVMIRVLRQ